MLWLQCYIELLHSDGEWIPNENGGNENLEAVKFLQQANHVLFQHFPVHFLLLKNRQLGQW